MYPDYMDTLNNILKGLTEQIDVMGIESRTNMVLCKYEPHMFG